MNLVQTGLSIKVPLLLLTTYALEHDSLFMTLSFV